MKPLLALYFFILSTIQLGLFLGLIRYSRSQVSAKPSPYWMGSLAISILALIIFGAGILVNQAGVANPEFNFTIANTLFFLAAALQLLFCHSLNHPITKRMRLLVGFSVGLFFTVFEFMRHYGSFEIRTIFICALLTTFFVMQIFEVQKKFNKSPSVQLRYLQYVTAMEMCFALGRIVILMINSFSINQLNEVPQVLIFFTIAQIVMNTLAYIAIGAYWTEVMVLASNRVESENLKIKSLLLEREALISGLLKDNKTVATGALSASIAHELNQPLGASYLNIQFLQKKLAEGSLTAEQNQEVLSALLSDNQRAANIIRSLRSIFSDGKIGAEQLDLDELSEAVLKITKPEIQSKNIQVVLSLSSNTLVNINRTEIQQVVLNLINNAIQALAESRSNAKTLKIESHDVADGVEILITDNGPGIPMEAQSHLFELLADSNKKTGMGLGLWLCRHIITRHGGNIEYQDAKGGGAQFGIFLPSSPN